VKTLIIKFNLKIGSYNVHGVNDHALSYIESLMDSHDFMLIQEHWLQSSQLHIFQDKIKNIFSYGISGMNEYELHSGRPYGGCAILWRDSLSCKVTPILCDNSRLCLVKVCFNTCTLLLCTVYMPCDTEYDNCNNDVYNEILLDMLKFANDDSIDFVMCGGDFNTDMIRTKSLHTNSLQAFMAREHFKLCDSHSCSSVDYTYESMANYVRSNIDHMIVSENMFEFVSDVKVIHDIDNLSDHSMLSVSLNISVEYAHTQAQNEAKLIWASATANDIATYKINIDHALDNIILEPDILYCSNHFCTSHHDKIASLHDNIISCCLLASRCIPTKNTVNTNKTKSIPGWTEYVAPYRSDALFWHALWKDNGSPASGYVADIRRRTRYLYHNVLRKVKKNEGHIRSTRMAQNIYDCNYVDFWNNIKKMKGNKSSSPTTVDGAGDAKSIGSLFQ